MPGNTETYKAILKCERWRDVVGLSIRDACRLADDMQAVIDTLKDQSAELKRLRLSVISMKTERQVKRICDGSVVPASKPVSLKAQAVAEAAGGGPIDVYRYPIGTVRWLKAGTKYEGRGELVGTYDAGCDWRRIAEDLTL